jgi:hypothetical protein
MSKSTNNYRIPTYNPEEITYNCQDCVFGEYNKSLPANKLQCNQFNDQVSTNGTCDLIEPMVL